MLVPEVEKHTNKITYVHGLFVKELSNRFLAEVEVGGKVELCYLPSSCHLSQLIDLSGRETLLLPIKKKNARTKYSVYAVKDNTTYILLNLVQCNDIIEKEIHRRYFSFLGKRKHLLREVKIADYKTDLFIEDTNTIVEIKSILSSEHKAFFPSVHSKRALAQLRKLLSLLDSGHSICYVFVSVNPRTKAIIIDETNTEYCNLFRECIKKGMSCCGVSITIKDGEAKINARLRVDL